MKGLFKQSLAFLGYHAVFAFVSLVFVIPFSKFLYYNDGVVKPVGAIIYTFLLLILYLPAIYSAMWNLGKNHASETSDVKPSILFPIKVSVVSEIPTFILLVLMLVNHFNNPNDFNMYATLFNLWQSMYMCILNMSKIIYILMVFVPVITAVSGYIAGTKNIAFMDKYVYPLIFKKNS